MKSLFWPVLLAWVVLPTAAFGASFHCAKAGTPVEKAVCDDKLLSRLDSELGAAYRNARAAVAPSSKNALIKEQQHWVRYVRDPCPDRACLVETYKDRIAILRRNEKYLVDKASCELPEGHSCRSVVRYRDPAARIDSFNRSLAASGNAGQIIGCTRLIDLPVGIASGNHSFGGLCTLEDEAGPSKVMICNDNLVGRVAVQKVGEQATGQDLIGFTNSHCFGG